MAASPPEAYSKLFVTLGMADVADEAAAFALELTQQGYPRFAQEVARAMLRYQQELRAVAHRIAGRAKDSIVEAERSSRVRDDTQGEGGARLEDYIGKSDALDAVPGSVGVNDEQFLEASPVSWWWTNEEGFSGHVGREIKGVFFDPGFTNVQPPRGDMFRHHPLFQPAGRGRKAEIKRPIPDRRFVQDGQSAVAGEWHAAIDQARTAYDREIDRILTRFRAAVQADARRRRP